MIRYSFLEVITLGTQSVMNLKNFRTSRTYQKTLIRVRSLAAVTVIRALAPPFQHHRSMVDRTCLAQMPSTLWTVKLKSCWNRKPNTKDHSVCPKRSSSNQWGLRRSPAIRSQLEACFKAKNRSQSQRKSTTTTCRKLNKSSKKTTHKISTFRVMLRACSGKNLHQHSQT